MASVEDLLTLFKQFERDFRITENLARLMTDFERMKDRTKFYIGNTIRREQPQVNSELDFPELALPLYEKLVLHLYEQLLKKELASENDELNSFVCDFHATIALNLFNFIKFRKVTHDQLLLVVYYLLQLTSSRKKAEEQAELIRKNLQRIREMFLAMLVEE